ncbi:hypothetical protein [Microvirga sp. TS319]|uniref:hypothetical protein n=1 Tax=Microvirga sp. TS319 TaxID=3241165 RepID=UPI003519E782
MAGGNTIEPPWLICHLLRGEDRERSPIGHGADDGPEGFLIAAPHAWRDDRLWHDMQAEMQERSGMKLRELYFDLLEQPLSPGLTGLVQEMSWP